MKTILCSLLITFSLVLPAHATTYTIRPDGTGDFPSIQAAITASVNGDTILLDMGTYYGNGNYEIDFQGKAITVSSLNGDPNTCIVNCLGSSSLHRRGFVFMNGEGSDSELIGITIENGYWTRGAGAICWDNSSPSFESCVFRNNISYDSPEGAGAVWCDGSPSFKDCVFESNQAKRGGAVFCDYSNSVLFDGCEFRGNSAWYHGGAIYCFGTPTITDCVFIDNSASQLGGAIHGGPFVIEDCTFHGNNAGISGSAISLGGSDQYQIDRSTFCFNESTDGGTIACNADHHIHISNTIIAFSENSPSFACDGDPDLFISCTDIFGNDGGDWIDCLAGNYGINGNISEDPLFFAAELEDWHLLPLSPCAPFSDPNPSCDQIGAWPVGFNTDEASCCLNEECFLLIYEDCYSIGGDWDPDYTSCNPNPCTPWTLRINASGTGDFPTIQSAITRCRDGDTIELEDGIFTGLGNRDLEFQGRAITLRAAVPHSESCIIDCQGNESDQYRAFDFMTEDLNTVIEDIVIKNGYASLGGGAFFHEGATPLLIRCVFSDNTATLFGGAAYVSGAAPLFQNCKFSQNSAPLGGGGLYFTEGATCQLENCDVTDNMALSGSGGGLYSECSANIFRCLFNGNLSPVGGGIASVDSEALISNCTLYANHASDGGGIWCNGGGLTVQHSIIAGSTFGGAVYCVEEFTALLECCNVFGNAGGDYTGCIDWLFGQLGNISADPLLCDPENSNYHLQSRSPCAPGTECDLIGAYEVGCDYMDVSDTQSDELEAIRFDCFPNPSSANVNLVYSIPNDISGVDVKMSVLDVSGRCLHTAIHESVQPGTHQYAWSPVDNTGNSLPGGIYLYVFHVDDQRITRRVLLVR